MKAEINAKGLSLPRRIYCRSYQALFRLALPFLPYRNPNILNCVSDIPAILKKEHVRKPLIITDATLSSLKATQALTDALQSAGNPFSYFDKTFSNPTTQLALEAAHRYHTDECDCLIAYGGGSPMDLAKAVGVCIARPHRPLHRMAGILKVRRRIPLLIAVPTTAGTGSETTLAAVLVDEDTRHKFAINDFPLIPRYAVLDPAAIHTLPTEIMVCTGLDAAAAERHPDAERAMLWASHLAGRAFTRSYVGYVHALSHSLSGCYNLPHGWTNAILLPIVLRHYGDAVEKKLAQLCICAELGREGEPPDQLAERFIQSIEEKNRRYGIPTHIDALREEDLSQLTAYAEREANPLYPVPVLWSRAQLEIIYREVMSHHGSIRH